MKMVFAALVMVGILVVGAPSYAAKAVEKNYSGNVKTLKFHVKGCKFFNCRTCTKFFPTYAAARKAGYEPCGVCKPNEVFDKLDKEN